MKLTGFDAAKHAPTQEKLGALPPGDYTVEITDSQQKTTKAGTGQYIAIKYTVTGPTMQGRVVFGNLNIKNPNQKAEEIGREQLGQIMRATGLAKVTDTDMLIGGQLAIKLSIQRNEQYGDSNDVKAFKAIAGAVPAAMPTTPFGATPAPAATPAKGSPPWAKK